MTRSSALRVWGSAKPSMTGTPVLPMNPHDAEFWHIRSERVARGIEARSAETRSRLGPQGRKPGPQDAPKSWSMDTNRGFLARLFGARK